MPWAMMKIAAEAMTMTTSPASSDTAQPGAWGARSRIQRTRPLTRTARTKATTNGTSTGRKNHSMPSAAAVPMSVCAILIGRAATSRVGRSPPALSSGQAEQAQRVATWLAGFGFGLAAISSGLGLGGTRLAPPSFMFKASIAFASRLYMSL